MSSPGPSGTPARRESFGVQAAVVVAIIVLFVIVVVVFARHDVLSGWRVVATCGALEAPTATPLSEQPATTLCAAPLQEREPPTGKPVVTFALPATAGQDADVALLVTSATGDTITMDYSAGEQLMPYPYTLVFVEVQPADVPEVPFQTRADDIFITITGAS